MGPCRSKHGIQMQKKRSMKRAMDYKKNQQRNDGRSGREAGWHENGVGMNATIGGQREKERYY